MGTKAQVGKGSRLGRRLRELREKRHFSMGSVSRQSQVRAIDRDGSLTTSYLSLLEAGRAQNPSLSKMLTLSAIYDIDVVELIKLCDEPHGTSLVTELMESRAAGRPEPHRLPIADGQSEFFTLFRQAVFRKAGLVHIPHSHNEQCFRRADEVLFWAALCALVANDFAGIGRGPLQEFWKNLRKDDAYASSGSKSSDHAWDSRVDHFAQWALGRVSAEAMADVVGGWSMDWWKNTFDVHFTDSAVESAYGFNDLPIPAAVALCRVNIASLISLKSAVALSKPSPTAAIAEYLAALVTRLKQSSDWRTPNRISLGSLTGTIRLLSSKLPSIVDEAPDPGVESVIRLVLASSPPSKGTKDRVTPGRV